MSKEQEYDNDRIPSYEDSTASSTYQGSISLSSSSSMAEKAARSRTSIQERSRLRRSRLVQDLARAHIAPAIDQHVEGGGTGTTVAILIPSNTATLPPSAALSTASVTSPALSSNTSVSIVRLDGDDYNASFLLQPAVVCELASALLAGLTTVGQGASPALAPPHPPPYLEPLPARPQPDQPLSAFKYMAGMPASDRDPTGSTGSWNLGWRSDGDPAETSATVGADEVTVSTRLQDVTFRIENEMGLLESANVRCVWCAVELRDDTILVLPS